MKLFARDTEIFRLGNVLVVLGVTTTIFRERGCMNVCVRILRSQNAVPPCALFLSLTYVPESGRGHDEVTGNTKPSRKYFGGSRDIAWEISYSSSFYRHIERMCAKH